MQSCDCLLVLFALCLSSGSWDGLFQEISKLVAVAGGIWGGAAGGAAGYTLTFAIAYLRDFGLDYRILSESLETMVPWSILLCIRLVLKVSLNIFEHLLSRLPTKTDSTCVFFFSQPDTLSAVPETQEEISSKLSSESMRNAGMNLILRERNLNPVAWRTRTKGSDLFVIIILNMSVQTCNIITPHTTYTYTEYMYYHVL